MSVKTFFEKIGEWLKEIGSHEASYEQAASTALKVAAPLLNELVALTAGEAAAAKVQSVVTQIQADMAGAATVLASSGATTGHATVSSFLGAINDNLGTLLADADVKNSTKFTKIESTIQTVIGEVQAITSALPKPATA